MDLFRSPIAVPLVCLLAVSGCGWTVVLARRARGCPIIAWQHRRRVPWGLVDLLIGFGLWLLMSILAGELLRVVWTIPLGTPLEKLPADAAMKAILAGSFANLAAVVVTLLVVHWKSAAAASDFGLAFAYGDVLLGVGAYLLLAGPVYMIQGLLVYWWPSHHPLVDVVRGNPDARFFWACGLSAVLVAPVTEELVFRGLLQGWLEKLPSFRGAAVELLLGRTAKLPDRRATTDIAENDTRRCDEPVTGPERNDVDKPHAAPASYPTRGPSKGDSADGAEVASRAAVLPVLASATIFALMHYAHGPDPIPLFVLALGLGYLYQRTHRLLPCIVVHLLLNAVSLAFLAVDVLGVG